MFLSRLALDFRLGLDGFWVGVVDDIRPSSVLFPVGIPLPDLGVRVFGVFELEEGMKTCQQLSHYKNIKLLCQVVFYFGPFRIGNDLFVVHLHYVLLDLVKITREGFLPQFVGIRDRSPLKLD